MKIYTLIVTALLIGFFNFAQNNTIGFNEKLVFSASYNMSGVLTDIAEVKMETSKVTTSKSTLMRLKCTATTYSKWDSFFKIRDLYESYVNPKTVTPYLYKRDINEGGYYKFMQYKFSHKTAKINSLKRKKRGDGSIWEEKKVIGFNASAKDLVSTLYYLRSLDIHKANIGDTQNFTIVFDNKQRVLTIKLLGKETINTAIGKKECYKIGVSLKGSKVLNNTSKNMLWLTADANKIPVFAQFKIPVGSGELKIKSAAGLKH